MTRTTVFILLLAITGEVNAMQSSPTANESDDNLKWRPIGRTAGRNDKAIPPQTNPQGQLQSVLSRPDTMRTAGNVALPAPPQAYDVVQASGVQPLDASITPAGQAGINATRIDVLPNTAGQVWREYNIQPYTSQITSNANPQQAIVDWILRDTGTELWFNEPLGILSANRNSLYVYHTPEIQNVVQQTVDRFIQSRGAMQTLGVRMVTVGSPNWRAAAYSMMQPVDVQSPGVEGWMISKENAAILINQLRRRGDFNQHNMGTLNNHDGQKLTLNRTRPIDFVQAIRWNAAKLPPYETIPSRINEGYTLEISSLTSSDNRTVDAVINCHVDQVEKLQNVIIDVPGVSGRAQPIELKIPQMVSWRLNERFRWSSDQVLLLSCGVVATPTQENNVGLNLQLFNRSRGRADALLFIDHQGVLRQSTAPRNAVNPGLVPVPARR